MLSNISRLCFYWGLLGRKQCVSRPGTCGIQLSASSLKAGRTVRDMEYPAGMQKTSGVWTTAKPRKRIFVVRIQHCVLYSSRVGIHTLCMKLLSRDTYLYFIWIQRNLCYSPYEGAKQIALRTKRQNYQCRKNPNKRYSWRKKTNIRKVFHRYQ